MKERAFNMIGYEVRAVLAGTKTQVRRLVKNRVFSNGIRYSGELGDIVCHNDYLPPSTMLMEVRRGKDRYHVADVEGWESECPYGQVGDRLWVRETWWHFKSLYLEQAGFQGGTQARLDGDLSGDFHRWDEFDPANHPHLWRKRPSIHMPRWASRITLEVTGVRVERLQDISEDDARAEGVDWAAPIFLPGDDDGHDDREDPREVGYSSGSFARQNFTRLWDSINGERAPWASNPWVWVIEFRRLP